MSTAVFDRLRAWAFRATTGFTARSRSRRYELFMDEMHPSPDETILDVGVVDSDWRSSNPLEMRYPYPERITAVSLEAAPAFGALYPKVTLVIADGRALPFEDGSFGIGFSNAVIEHVGGREDQRRFVNEMVRTCRRSLIATPNAAFPVDPHTLLPFVHWLPRPLRWRILRATGNGKWASDDALNPLTARTFRALFPPDCRVTIVRQRFLWMTTVLIAVAEGPDGGAPPTRTGS
jgi:Methyltransferase domain